MNEATSVLLTGATAQVGLHVLRELLNAGIKTIALSRKIAANERIDHASGANVTWHNPEHFSSSLCEDKAVSESIVTQPDYLMSAGPISLAEVWLDRCESFKGVVCLSTSSVLIKADSAHPAERRQIEEILESEKRLIATCSTRGIGLVILRPTLIYGCGMDENISRIAQLINRFGFVPLAGKARGLRQPIHVADLAQLMVTILLAKVSGQSSYEVAGGSTLTYRDMAARVFPALGKPERLFSLPPALLAGGVAAASKLPSMSGLNPQMVFRQDQDMVFADMPIRQRFNFQPRGFQPVAEDFDLPAEIRQLLPSGFSSVSR